MLRLWRRLRDRVGHPLDQIIVGGLIVALLVGVLGLVWQAFDSGDDSNATTPEVLPTPTVAQSPTGATGAEQRADVSTSPSESTTASGDEVDLPPAGSTERCRISGARYIHTDRYRDTITLIEGDTRREWVFCTRGRVVATAHIDITGCRNECINLFVGFHRVDGGLLGEEKAIYATRGKTTLKRVFTGPGRYSLSVKAPAGISYLVDVMFAGSGSLTSRVEE